jgi:hypothetical protein
MGVRRLCRLFLCPPVTADVRPHKNRYRSTSPQPMNERHTVTLNVRYDIPEEEWAKILDVYRSMDGWLEGAGIASWYGSEHDSRFIIASVEPSGILLEAQIEPDLWASWVTVLCARLTNALGREVQDAEL